MPTEMDQSFGATSMDTLSIFDRAASHPNPAFDFLTGFIPRKLKDNFKWVEWLYFKSAHVYAANRKFGELAVTSITYDTANLALLKRKKRLMEKDVKIRNNALLASLDLSIYGNHFSSPIRPFVRRLKCGRCGQLVNIEHVDYKFKLASLSFSYHCKQCHAPTTGKIVDEHIVDPKRVHLKRWDPKEIDIDYSPFSGKSVYYWNIPQDQRDKIRLGAKHLINTCPYEVLVAVKDKLPFKFAKGAIIHLKTAGPAGVAPEWGIPPLLSALGLFLYAMVLRKANEAIALEHVVPFRVMHPAATNGTDPAGMISLLTWQRNMKEGLRRYRRDPLHVLFSPVAVGVTNIGGEGRALLTLGEVQEADKAVMAALGLPLEFLYGGLTKAGMEGTLILIQNQLQAHADALSEYLDYYDSWFSRYLGWEATPMGFVPVQLVKDSEVKQAISTLALGQQPVVSLTTLIERHELELDLEKERSRRMEEALAEARLQWSIQNKVQQMQNTLSAQAQAQAQGEAGLRYDVQAVVSKAEGIVQQFATMDEGTRRSQLHDLQVTDYVMYSVVVQRMEQQQLAQQHQAMQQGGAPPPGGV